MVPLVSAFIKTDSALRMLNEIVFGFLQLEVVHVEPPVDISAIEDELVGGNREQWASQLGNAREREVLKIL